MIVCSCNILSDGDVKACLKPGPDCPRTPAQVYRCLGCSPDCGRCARTIRAIMDQALATAQAGRAEPCTGLRTRVNGGLRSRLGLADAGVQPIAACQRGCCPTTLEKAAAEPTL
jgi:bacterioferritin-associated ferredoxin